VRRRGPHNFGLVGLALLGASLAVPATASADTVTCSFLPGGPLPLPPLVSVQITPEQTRGPGELSRVGNEIWAGPTTTAGRMDCGGSVLNTALIALGDASPQGQGNVHAFHIPVGSTAFFAPGLFDEAGDSDEIEYGVAFGPGMDSLELDAFHGGGDAATIRLGSDGQHELINFNAAEATGIDFDISMDGVDRVGFTASFNPVSDEIRGTGGAGTGGSPFPLTIIADLHQGNDLAAGGNGNDVLYGATGADTLIGNAGQDLFQAGAQADKVFGGSGPDDATAGDGADLLAGGDGRDGLVGEIGADVLRGGQGRDLLRGGPGSDELVGGPGFDTCFGGLGNDTFKGCEVIHP
jgi:RTX calcium-binding nonapeptide repeat (4 copies)